ncbi:stage II sporulation protein Q [Peribacillus deserti]|uniref:Stage II sporulation protein Q n=1 Tax=Peribacillus deserti TaxID=673318 RepID=A0ABS2QC26_9BACI|nr:M23 family metallopeptidase [Peribacillus deserti]MBM7690706.1 stage II sporulation protein Q [Peribacillus deserti]
MREEEKKRTSQKSNFQRIIKKRWALPAIYILVAAIVLSAALWYQNAGSNSANPDDQKSAELGKNDKQPAVEANRSLENFSMPVKDQDNSVVKKDFYDEKASKEQQEAALVFYNNTYQQNKGMDFAMKDGKDFNVIASLSGKVTRVEEDSVLGNVVEVEHSKGIVTRYSSVQGIKVAVGDEVSKGQAIAKAGQSLLNEEAGTHVHFEIRKDDVAVNPKSFFEKSLADLQETNVAPDESEKITEEDQADAEGTQEENVTEDSQAKEESQSQKSEDKGTPAEEKSEENTTDSQTKNN